MSIDPNALRYQIANWNPPKPDAYNPYAAGPKMYGPAGTGSPNSGPVGMSGQQGYQQRDQQALARRNAYLARLRADQNGAYISPEWLGMQSQ